ncbi:MAG: hypothetical protein LBQ13_04445 [Endomicrobium sp.]|jgi:aspartate aminotransferase-like enzyme|nr:hypothetical protein [Endomicrobium sp.]
MLAPGLAFITLSDKAWKFTETSKIPKFYFDIKKYKKSYVTNETPFTPPITLIVALMESIRLIKEKGLENMWERLQGSCKSSKSWYEGFRFGTFWRGSL